MYLRYSYSLCYASILNFYFTFKYKLALTMALYEGFDMTFVKMPKYLPTNKYQNKDGMRPYFSFLFVYGIIQLPILKGLIYALPKI